MLRRKRDRNQTSFDCSVMWRTSRAVCEWVFRPPRNAAYPPPPWNRLVKNQGDNIKPCSFEFWSFPRSTSVNNVFKLLQLLGDFVPQTPYRDRLHPWTPLCDGKLGDFRLHFATALPNKNSQPVTKGKGSLGNTAYTVSQKTTLV